MFIATLFCYLPNSPEGARELAAERRELEAREEAVRDTGREVGLSLDQGRSVLGRERNKLQDESEKLSKASRALGEPCPSRLVADSASRR